MTHTKGLLAHVHNISEKEIEYLIKQYLKGSSTMHPDPNKLRAQAINTIISKRTPDKPA